MKKRGMNKGLKIGLIIGGTIIGLFILAFIGLVIYYMFSGIATSGYDCETRNAEILLGEEFEQIGTYYYLNPQPDKIVPYMNTLIEGNLFKDETLDQPFILFFSEVFKQNPEEIEDWLIEEMCGLNEWDTRTWDIMIESLWLSNTTEGKEVAFLIKEGATNSGKTFIDQVFTKNISGELNPKTWTVRNAKQLDALWGGFFASGEEIYIQQIIEAVPYKWNENPEIASLGIVAEWSLTSNAQQHERVMQILEQEITNTDLENKKIALQEIVGKAKETE